MTDRELGRTDTVDLSNKNKYLESVQYLSDSLIFQMSLGSKELFHSNVWAWLIGQDREFIKVFFTDFDEKMYRFISVERETCNRDVIIWLQKQGYTNKDEKYYLVIENKIKSLPTKEQLENYTENIDGNKCLQGVFTGIKNTLERDESINKSNNVKLTWKFVDYNTIAARIREIAHKSDKVSERISQIDEYCDIVEKMNYLLSEELKRQSNAVNFDCYKENNQCYLEVLRIKDIFTKLKGAQILKALKDKLSHWDNSASSKYNLVFRQGFNNGSATLDAEYTNWTKGCKDYLTIGVQIQGCQYRIFATRNETHRRQEVFDSLKNEWFDATFNEKAKERKIFGYGMAMKNKCDKYSGKDYIFVYQYFNIKDWLLDDVIEVMKGHLQKARAILESGRFD